MAGLEALAFAVPQYFIDLTDLAVARGIAPDKYTVGLGRREMSVATPCETATGRASKEGKTVKSATNASSDGPSRDWPNGVRIVSAQDFPSLDVKVPASFELRFPRHWIAQPVRNKYAAAVGRETLAWLASYGMGRSRDEAEKLRKFDCGMYGGLSLPLANYQTALLVTQFISLWLFWDDEQFEKEDDFCIEAVVEAFIGCAEPRPPSRYLAAWADIGRRLRRTQSEAWLGRLESTMREWLENARFETRLARAFKRGGACPDFATFFDRRAVSTGMFLNLNMVEFAEGLELDESFHKRDTVVALKRLAARLVGLGNDLGGLAKDINNRWPNLVLAQMEQFSLKIEDAFQRVVDIHNADVEEFDRLASDLPSGEAGTDALARGWVQAVRHNVFGFTLWESSAERYQESKAVVGGKALIAPVVIAPVHVRPLAETLGRRRPDGPVA